MVTHLTASTLCGEIIPNMENTALPSRIAKQINGDEPPPRRLESSTKDWMGYPTGCRRLSAKTCCSVSIGTGHQFIRAVLVLESIVRMTRKKPTGLILVYEACMLLRVINPSQ
jgi:hypothetical protein